ncbi:MAG: 4-hydroxy-tetrahydrodipicolinate reductase [Oscillospiraceae bacterium]|nr:4-hydroxy-tetrahydrodipicolinate reductase [Oscillospiraceae bacterium]
MKKIIVTGVNGRMGRTTTEYITNRDDCLVVAGVDKKAGISGNFKIFASMEKIDKEADVLIDFSHPEFINQILNFCIRKKLPAVICTTGFSDFQNKKILSASSKIPIFLSENMSIGINLMTRICKEMTRVLEQKFDIEIIERHHNKKIDAPSGTALMLANAISSMKKDKQKYVYDRHFHRNPRTKNEIGISCVRGGSIIGDHEVIFAGDNETLSVRHSAQSKEVFVAGAVNAALFICTKSPGLYTMSDLLEFV